MVPSVERLRHIYDRTYGRCHICHKKVSFSNYGTLGARGAWEVEHSNPRAKGGTDRLNNLYAAHIECNRSKGTLTTARARARYGHTRAPLSAEGRSSARSTNAFAGSVFGALVGLRAGPIAALVCACLGAFLGDSMNPEE
jgi:5-methylcytosine-specific restriction endonuclease McrA